MARERTERYLAAGGVVVHGECVLVLRRPLRAEVRLPKGHVEQGEELGDAAVRETTEESGYGNLHILADLGVQEVAFEFRGRQIRRVEHFYLMELGLDNEETGGAAPPPVAGEAQFSPVWLPWRAAIDALSFPAEKEWVRRAHALVQRGLVL